MFRFGRRIQPVRAGMPSLGGRLVLAMVTSAVIVTGTNVTGQDGALYTVLGPAGLNVSVRSASGAVSVNRILRQIGPVQTNDVQNATNQNATTTYPLQQDDQQQQQLLTDTVWLRVASLRQTTTSTINATGDSPRVAIELSDCNFSLSDDDGQSDCASFVCKWNESTVEERICFVSVASDEPPKSMVNLTLRIRDWTWSQIGADARSQLGVNFEFSIRKDLSITRLDGGGSGESLKAGGSGESLKAGGRTSFALGVVNSSVQFQNWYTEYHKDMTYVGHADPALILTETYKARVTVALINNLSSQVSSLQYGILLDPGYKAYFKGVIAGFETIVADFALLLFNIFVCILLS